MKNQRTRLLIWATPKSSSSTRILRRECPDCAFYWEVGVENCTCGKCIQPAEQNRQMNKDRFDGLSIPGYLMKKDQSRGARHGQSMRQIMYYQARDMVRKAKTKNNGQCKTIHERWYKDERYRTNLSELGWTEEQIRQYDALAVEDYTYVSTPERGRYWKSWTISVNKEGIQSPIRQRPDVREAKHTYLQLYKEHVGSTGECISPIHPAHQTKHNRQQF